ncbi:helix-turn-helix transcriptional regulator [Hafnia paralvei]|uniref:helix-turn-helix transcriptional regulator n=1 Tax=Hafnia paralvei TaxID=546367 RepID=UPI000BB53C99|nr:AlpA family phage regulatory protein [Hafnia paralvei]PNK67802.1 AlpA family phage regulatory protein [Hafnia paralvei]
MSVSNSEILLKGEVKARLRYRSDSAFYEFLKDDNGFPMPFKVGGRNCWYRDEVELWIGKQSERRGICMS